MIKSGKVPGSQVMHIITSNLESESAEEIVTDVLLSIVPAIINKYLPNQSYEKNNSLMFDIVMKLLLSGNFKEESTLQMLVTSIIGFAMDESERGLLLKWFNQD